MNLIKYCRDGRTPEFLDFLRERMSEPEARRMAVLGLVCFKSRGLLTPGEADSGLKSISASAEEIAQASWAAAQKGIR